VATIDTDGRPWASALVGPVEREDPVEVLAVDAVAVVTVVAAVVAAVAVARRRRRAGSP